MPEMQGLELGDSRAKCQKSKDENSVNREIATLLLNLASRTQAGPGADSADHFKSEMVYMCSSWPQLAFGSRDLSQAGKRITVV